MIANSRKPTQIRGQDPQQPVAPTCTLLCFANEDFDHLWMISTFRWQRYEIADLRGLTSAVNIAIISCRYAACPAHPIYRYQFAIELGLRHRFNQRLQPNRRTYLATSKEREPAISVADLEVSVENIEVSKAAEIFREHGCLVVRGLMKAYVDDMYRDIMTTVEEAIAELDQACKVPAGWMTPNNCLFLPAPENYDRDKQIMTVGINYYTSSAFFATMIDTTALDLVEAILGPKIETFGAGQSLVKEPVGGHPKHLHQDSAYFEHKHGGPVAILSYVIDTNLDNGALHVVPDSQDLGQLPHIDTFSHLGLDEHEWPWEMAVPVEGKAGDSIFFSVKTVHGSKPNYSDKPRPVFINRYRDPDDFTVVSASSAAQRTNAERAAEEVKKRDEDRGLMVRGFRHHKS